LAKVLLGITGGIAAYKAPQIIRLLAAAGIETVCVMTKEAKEFVTPLTLRTLSKNPVYDDMFFESKNPGGKVEHIDLARNCDAILVAPATANIIGKTACGIADDLLSTVIMSSKKPVVFAPAMNSAMWENPVVAANTGKLKKLGYTFIGPKKGELACGEYGAGHIEEPEIIASAIQALVLPPKKKARKKTR
jgi:phosphopantothenoylcysteine decarboxylase / phosphopantothenate---cysteine ligase